MSSAPRYIVLIIQIRSDLTVVLVWITRCPSQNTGRGFKLVSGWMRYQASSAAHLIPVHVVRYVYWCTSA
jgi:hypothetical protein